LFLGSNFGHFFNRKKWAKFGGEEGPGGGGFEVRSFPINCGILFILPKRMCEEHAREYKLCAVFLIMAMIIKNELIIIVDIVAVVGRHRFFQFPQES
jgi:hypothetical protein